MKKIWKCFLVGIIVTIVSSCKGKPEIYPICASHFCLDTTATITLYGSSAKDKQASDILGECFSICDRFEQTISKTIEQSEISMINKNSGKPVSVSDLTASLIKSGLFYGKLSNGAFDITIAPITELWDIKNNSGKIPPKKQICSAISKVNYASVQVQDNTITIPLGTKLDMGGIAKGRLADILKEHLISKGVRCAIINLGGNILTIGKKDAHHDFTIGIQKPFAENPNEYAAQIKVQDQSIVTSGIYERYFKKNGKLYHHIFNPKTGYPVENHLYSVTIISDSSENCDALSTAVFVLGKKQGLQLINSRENVEAVFIDSDYHILLSDGLQWDYDNIITFRK